MSRRIRTLAVLLVTLAASLAVASPAHAAVVPWESVSVSMHDEGGTQLLVVSGTLPTGTPLPAQVELPVPKSSQLSWAGEILGGPVENDPSAATTTRTVGDAEVHAFTLTRSLTGQVEVLVPGMILFDGSTYTARLAWTPVADLGEVLLEVRVPSSAEVVTPAEDAELVSGPGGESAYRRVVRDATAGRPLTLEFAYTAAAPTTAPVSGGGSGTVVLLVVLGVVIAAVLIAVVPRRMRRTAPAAPDVSHQTSETPEAPEEDDDGNGEADSAPGAVQGGKRSVIVLLVVGAILALVVFAMSTTRQTQQLGGELSREYAQGDACTKASIRLAEGADSEKVLTALESAQVVRAAIVPAERVLNVEFCDSQTTEEAIRAVLAPLGALE